MSERRRKKIQPDPSPTEPQAVCFKNGDFVILSDGALGMLCDIRIEPHYSTVQFGADGPLRLVKWRSLRHATTSEISAFGLSGVGHNTAAAEEAERRAGRPF